MKKIICVVEATLAVFFFTLAVVAGVEMRPEMVSAGHTAEWLVFVSWAVVMATALVFLVLKRTAWKT